MKHDIKRLIPFLIIASILLSEIYMPSLGMPKLGMPVVCAAENGYSYLLMPTQITKINNTYFIVDCNHNQIIYSDRLETDLRNWNVMTRNTKSPHALTSDGEIYLVADTDNNRILTFEKTYDRFKELQTFEDVGIRPHFADYDYVDELFYVWSSLTGEMYLYKKIQGTKSVALQEIRSIPELSGCYVRSFTILGDTILFPAVERSSILMVDKKTFEVLEEYPVPDCMAGMVQISLIDGFFFITISTDKQYNLQASTVIRTKTLEGLSSGDYETLYHLFGNSGTPYYVSHFDGAYYMIHQNTSPNMYRFHAENGTIFDIKKMF
ncbi:hypothetical protein FMM75_00960 [Lachnospiraceae bacterium MD335]|jgi:hypothetical protein|nr:hypothetical protein [Lachnospiraceae bacterium MD335]